MRAFLHVCARECIISHSAAERGGIEKGASKHNSYLHGSCMYCCVSGIPVASVTALHNGAAPLRVREATAAGSVRVHCTAGRAPVAAAGYSTISTPATPSVCSQS